jgi:putative cell wall-binding protein
VDGTDLQIVYSHEPGSTFPLGTTLVEVTVADKSSNEATTSFSVTVQDTTPPEVTPPADKTVEATGPAGASVTFSASATDLVDGPVPVTYWIGTTQITSPHTFPLGATVVTLKAVDGSGNNAQQTFKVTVGGLPPLEVNRYVGADRYGTAILVSKAAYPEGARYAFVAKGDNFPDALAAAPVAFAYDGPIVLTPSTGLTASVKAELARLNPDIVFFIGLSDSVKPGIQQAVPTAEIRTVRGVNRYETAAMLADLLQARLGEQSKTVTKFVLASGDVFPDALSVGPLAASKGWAILLTPQAGPLPEFTKSAVATLGLTKALIVGTRVQPPASVTDKLSLVGDDRYHTGVLIADYAKAQGHSFARIAVAKGDDHPDALVIGPYLARDKGILLLSRSTALPGRTEEALTANRDSVLRVDFPGLPAPIISAVEDLLR